MVEDDSSRQDGGFESLVTALRQAKREVGVAVGHGVDGVQHWMEEQWLPVQLVLLGGFSWTIGKAFGWLLSLFVGLGSQLVTSLLKFSTSISATRLVFAFFVVYALHSLGQTKLILRIKTKLERMDSELGSEVRADGGTDEEFSSRLGAIGGLLVGIIIGSAFGMDGAFVGAGVGWGLGNEVDRRFEAKANEAVNPVREEQSHVEKQ